MNLEERFNELAYGERIVNTREHLPYLRSVAKGNVLEIGTDVGNSTTALLMGVKENSGFLVSVDIEPCKVPFDEIQEQWLFIEKDSKKLAFGDKKFDVVYIDGDHSYSGVKSDIELALSVIKPGGLILMHDVEALEPPNAFPEVRKAFDEVKLPKHIRSGSYGLGVILAK